MYLQRSHYSWTGSEKEGAPYLPHPIASSHFSPCFLKTQVHISGTEYSPMLGPPVPFNQVVHQVNGSAGKHISRLLLLTMLDNALADQFPEGD